jgi:hypothetical protein
MADDYLWEAIKYMKLAKIKDFLVLNPGAVFIMFFAALVFTCAYLLIAGGPNDPNLDSIVVVAYCSLAVGIIVQAAGFIRAKALGARV